MSGLDVAASIAGLISIADLVFSRTYKYYKAAKNASKDIEKLANSIRSLSQLLHGLELLLVELEKESSETNFRLYHINSCTTTLTRIRETLDKNGYDAGPDESRPLRANLSLLHKLKWPFSSSETKELVVDVEQHISVINAALSGDTLASVLQALSKQNAMANDIQELRKEQTARWASETHILLSRKRRDVLEFFGKVDPTPDHQMSLKLRHPMTGLWFTEGSTFQAWLHSRNSKLWLSGIPGGGKTILAACAIEEAMKESSVNRAVAYFYCDYKNSEKQKPIKILGSLATQLARQSEKAYTQLEELHEVCHPKDRPSVDPDLEALLLNIRQMSSNFDDVSIIVDGLDECGVHTNDVIEFLVSLSSKDDSNTRLLLLSRDELGIRQLLQQYPHLEIAAHSEDLKLYVAAEIEARLRKIGRGQLRIKSKNSDLKEYMMKTLVERAQGMFRWVACQLDYLCELPTDDKKRKALTSLPPTLHATYERILDRVNKSDDSIRVMVQRTLQWVINQRAVPRPLSTAALCAAISVQNGDRIINEESLYDEEDILLHCSSLVRRSAIGDSLELAHFTVQEFLSAIPPDKDSPYAMYSQSEDLVYPQLAVTCLTYVNLECFQGNIIESFEDWVEQQAQYPFRRHAVENWDFYAENYWQNIEVQVLILELFNPSKTNCFLSWTRDMIYQSGNILPLPPPPPPPPKLDMIYQSGKIPSPPPPPKLRNQSGKPPPATPTEGDPDSDSDSETSNSQNSESPNRDFAKITNNVYSGGVTPLHMAAFLGFPELCRSLLALGCNVNQVSNMGNPLYFALLGTNLKDLFCLFTGRRVKLALYIPYPGPNVSTMQVLVAAGAQLDEALVDTLKEQVDDMDSKDDFHNGKEVLDILAIAIEQDPSKSVAHSGLSGILFQRDRTYSPPKLIENDLSFEMTLEKLTDSLILAVRFDQVDILRELLKDKRLDIDRFTSEGNKTLIHWAAGNQSSAAVEILLENGASVDPKDKQGQTPLHHAVANVNERSQRCLLLLLDHGASIGAQDLEGCTVWHHAAKNNNTPALRVLLSRVKDATKNLSVQQKDGFIPLYLAAHNDSADACELLLSQICHIPQMGPDGIGLVHYTVRMNSVAMLRLLPEKGLDLNQRTKDGKTAFEFLPENVDSEIVRQLVEAGVGPTLSGETPLHSLLCLREIVDHELLRLLATDDGINMPTLEGWTPLHYAFMLPPKLRACDRECYLRKEYAEILVSKGANVHVRDARGKSCLQLLFDRHTIDLRSDNINYGFAELLWFLVDKISDLDILQEQFDWKTYQTTTLNWAIAHKANDSTQLLIEKGVDVDLRHQGPGFLNDLSALGFACVYGCEISIFRQLVKKSFCLHDVDNHGRYLTHIACHSQSKASSALLEQLLDFGLNPNFPMANSGAETPLMLAAAAGKLDHIKVLLDHNANIHARDSLDREAIHHAVIGGHLTAFQYLSTFDSINWSHRMSHTHKFWGYEGCNVLHTAVIEGNKAVFEYIIQNSFITNVNCRTLRGYTPLHLVAISGKALLVAPLLKSGAEIESKVADSLGDRPIHLAALHGELNVVQELLNHGCSLVPNSKGMTPQLLALKNNHTEILDMLRSHEARSEIATLAETSESESQANQKLKELRWAVHHCDLELCKRIVESGFDVNQTFTQCSGCKPLLYAFNIKEPGTSNCEIARYLIDKGFSSAGSICDRSPLKGYTAVHLACRDESQIHLLRIFLAQDSQNGHLAFQSPITPLHVAVANKNSPALKLLLQHLKTLDSNGSPADVGDQIDCLPNSPAPVAKKGQIGLLSLLDAQIERSKLRWDWLLFDKTDDTPEKLIEGTCLHIAAYTNNTEAIELLLEHGASIDSFNVQHDTPLHLAIVRNHTECVSMLVKRGANLDFQNADGGTAALTAAMEGDVEIMKLVLRSGVDVDFRDDFGWTLLHCAAKGGPRVFSYLLCFGCDPYMKNCADETPLDIFMDDFPAGLALICNWNLDFERLTGILFGPGTIDSLCSRSRTRFLLKRLPTAIVSQEIDTTGPGGRTPLGIAARLGDLIVLELLIRAGANLEVESASDGTPLLVACATGSLSTVKYLVRAGASSFGRRKGKLASAVEVAANFSSIVRWFLVERYTDQHQVTFGTGTEREVSKWAGVISVEMELCKLPYSPIHGASRLEHAKELFGLKRRLRGTILNI